MKLHRLLLILLFAPLLIGCSGGKKAITGSIPSFTVIFGKTGGFTNTNPVYIVNSKGEVSKKMSLNATAELINKIPLSATDSIYTLLKKTGFLEQKIHFPSNISRYIELQRDTIYSRIVWENDSQITPEIKILHLYLLKLIKK